MARVFPSTFDRSFYSYTSSLADAREEACQLLEDCSSEASIPPLASLLRKMRDTRYTLTDNEVGINALALPTTMLILTYVPAGRHGLVRALFPLASG